MSEQGSNGWLMPPALNNDSDRLHACLDELETIGTELQVLRISVKNLLPIGNDRLPDERVIPIYVRMDELRALHALATTTARNTSQNGEGS